MIERDYLMRLLQQLATVMRRILRLQEQEKYDEAQQELAQAPGRLLGLERELLVSLAPATAAALLGKREKIKIAARLLQAEAELAGRRGDPELAHSRRQNALELYLEALVLAAQIDADDRIMLRAWAAEGEREALAERYQRLLAEFLAE
ncbi:MAG: hypothetical protein ONB48_10580 [candidate division KSB1 bacterium]|nr:hypothetical protein [candidate division KSB1 bacterium]MDZ7273933.1 hypothetical protein [candidate division KSB1 bacterium]MDZ7286089.1 hypothetical protein [candidate division KSB1 bacterium]MDZ7299121.1 hypothetical protein [candidate division KSB1 bacterium]MDZ7306668.1 hypothetical protein [candidate division KSB1 bacterium]